MSDLRLAVLDLAVRTAIPSIPCLDQRMADQVDGPVGLPYLGAEDHTGKGRSDATAVVAESRTEEPVDGNGFSA